MTPTTFAEAEALIRSLSLYPIDAIVFYGSRTRGTASLDSDWDAVVFVGSAPPDFEHRHVLRDEKLDILEVSWGRTQVPEWYARELCACVLQPSSIWTEPTKRPDWWRVDWDQVIQTKRSFVQHNARRFEEMWKSGAISKNVRRLYKPRLRRMAQRVAWMEDHHDIPSRPELDAHWENLGYTRKRAILLRAGISPYPFGYGPPPQGWATRTGSS